MQDALASPKAQMPNGLLLAPFGCVSGRMLYASPYFLSRRVQGSLLQQDSKAARCGPVQWLQDPEARLEDSWLPNHLALQNQKLRRED